MTVEVTIILKDSEKTMRHKFLEYEEMTMSPDCPLIQRMIEESKKSFDGEPEDIIVRTSMTVV